MVMIPIVSLDEPGCPATNTLLGRPVECDRGAGHTGPHMTRESWQWFDAPEAGES